MRCNLPMVKFTTAFTSSMDLHAAFANGIRLCVLDNPQILQHLNKVIIITTVDHLWEEQTKF